MCRPGRQPRASPSSPRMRQAAVRTDAWQARRRAGPTRQTRNAAGRHRLFQRGSILTPGILNSMPGPRSRLSSRLSSFLSSRRSSSRRSSRRSALIPSRSRVSTHRSWQTGPSHSCRHTRCALACDGIKAVKATAVAAIPKVLKIILTSSSFRNSATDPGADRHGKLFELLSRQTNWLPLHIYTGTLFRGAPSPMLADHQTHRQTPRGVIEFSANPLASRMLRSRSPHAYEGSSSPTSHIRPGRDSVTTPSATTTRRGGPQANVGVGV
jgi:hypothetical protein